MAQPPPAQADRAAAEPAPVVAPRRSLRVSIPAVVIGLVFLGSLAYLVYVVAAVEDEQIPALGAGFVALGASLAAMSVWSLLGMWRAASRARGGRAFGLAIFGGLAALGAIGCFTVAAIATLVTSS
ncbi:MAG TPA: hypothetical protein VNL94_07020 [Candidatus Binatia bacterium]|nr:hypothetical protein [Candidatus Binatia bacterium]